MKALVNLFELIFSLKSQKNVENTVLFLATFGFVIHLLLIFLYTFSIIEIEIPENNLLSNPCLLYTSPSPRD